MELNRNHFFLIGLILLFLGLQFRMVESVVLNTKTSQFIAKRLKKQPAEATADFTPSLLTNNPPASRRTIRPPKWIGWMLISIGAVFVLHSFAMPKPQ